VAATSEIARNTLVHGRGGSMTVEKIVRDGREGIKIIFMDEGPGISDIDAAMCDGYTTAGSMGLGLPGARRLVDEFDIRSEVGKGTCVTLVNWSGRP
jgi:serine/threonine-protein kinase RsbT